MGEGKGGGGGGGCWGLPYKNKRYKVGVAQNHFTPSGTNFKF